MPQQPVEGFGYGNRIRRQVIGSINGRDLFDFEILRERFRNFSKSGGLQKLIIDNIMITD
jgi:hypothetical protein